MLKITIDNLHGKEIVSESQEVKVIDLIHDNQIDWMHACGKKGRCTSCKMIVCSGMENLNSLNEREQFFRENGRLNTHERLTCQAILKSGELVIRVAEENKFPHMKYSK